MLKRLTSLLLLLAVGAGVASGAPLHSGGRECAMEDSMEMMDCCKRARSHGDAPEVQAARLCCAVNCQNGGANGPASATRVSAPQVAPEHPAAAPETLTYALALPHLRRAVRPSHANESPPVYLLNLAFLI
jgi:hypothetical protein